ncbi:tetratricopeptide repeat protein [Desulfomarina sp.]
MGAKKTENQKPKKSSAITYLVIFILGFLTGVGFTVYKTSGTGRHTAAVADSRNNQDNETHQAILNMEAEVTANPDDYQAWRQLGNLYYDHDLPEKAIGAYTKSMELHEADANLLTDLGVMYRRNKEPEKAIASFKKAIQINSTHEQSRFNMGIVYMYDLNDPEKAFSSWQDLLRINPEARAANGDFVRDIVKQIKAQNAEKPGDKKK